MKIIVKEGSGKGFRLRLPTALMMNGLSAIPISAMLRRNNLSISRKQLRTLFRAVKAYKSKHPEWKLIEVRSNGGDFVEIVP